MTEDRHGTRETERDVLDAVSPYPIDDEEYLRELRERFADLFLDALYFVTISQDMADEAEEAYRTAPEATRDHRRRVAEELHGFADGVVRRLRGCADWAEKRHHEPVPVRPIHREVSSDEADALS